MVVLKAHGLLAGTDADALTASLTKLIDQGASGVILDISDILFVDSHGLEVLVQAAELMVRNGRTLKLSGRNPKLHEVLELTEVASLFEAYEDVESAVESCR